PAELLQSAMTLRSIATQAGQVCGPALGGLLYGVSPSLVYLLAAGACVAAARLGMAMHPARAADTATAAPDGAQADEVDPPRQGADLHSVLEGLRFVRRTPILLGAILLDLLAVLFGGVGALLAAAGITRPPIAGRAGRLLLTVVFLYGASIVVFGLSRSFPLSLAA